jgi:uncharacterized protein (TIGR04255 family)
MASNEPSNEIFPRPTVKQVIFQIRFPNLFYLESKIGELQLRIMEEFPESSLLIRRQVVFADVGPEVKPEDLIEKFDKSMGPKVWQFSSPKGYKLNVLSDSLDISSNFHKTYDNAGSDNRFRDIIAFCLEQFFGVTKLPIISRIGLRYIDECPLPQKNTKTYRDYYDTTFNLDRFPVEDATEMDFRTTVKRGDYFLRYAESLQQTDSSQVVVLDFDAFTTNVKPNQYLPVTDKLHQLIIQEWKQVIKRPVIDYMRGKET